MITDLELVKCKNCTEDYDPLESDAVRFANYCGRACELEFVDCGLEALHSVQDAGDKREMSVVRQSRVLWL